MKGGLKVIRPEDGATGLLVNDTLWARKCLVEVHWVRELKLDGTQCDICPVPLLLRLNGWKKSCVKKSLLYRSELLLVAVDSV